jgi:hypothetical protein
MIHSLLLSCLLPLTTCVSPDTVGQVQIAPAANVAAHPDSYYDHRSHERKERMERIQADREREHTRRMDYERESARPPGSFFFWRDSPERHEMKRQRLQDEEQKHETERLALEQALRDEAAHDRAERGLPDGMDL